MATTASMADNGLVANGSSRNGKTTKVINFGAGPAKLPEEVLRTAQAELIDYKGHGISVMEMSHRSPEFLEILTIARQRLKNLLNVPDSHKILFMQGGGTGQFSGVPLNLMSRTGSADYIVTGGWSAKAEKEAKKYGDAHLVVRPDKFNHIPDESHWSFSKNPSYVYYCDNETIHGVEFPQPPSLPTTTTTTPFGSSTSMATPLVADMSSNLLSRRIDVDKFGIIVASAQKNIGIAGVTVVIVRRSLIGHAMKQCPSILDYQCISDNDSIYNTPPCYSLYMMGLVYEWLLEHGGIDAIEARNRQKANLLYDAIDRSDGFYWSVVDRQYRSRMNVPFRVGSQSGNIELEKEFVERAKRDCGMIQLKGHRSVGGVRASIYNAMSVGEVQTLVDFMQDFREAHQ